MRAPVDHIYAPAFPPKLPWVNVAMLRMDQLRGSPVLVEFWDFCLPNSIRTLPYVKAWHERYASDGLRVIGVHSARFELSHDPDRVREAVARLGIEYPVVIDVEHQIWQDYDNMGWPARYLFTAESTLFEFHYGEGGYADTELAIQELLGVELEPLAPLRPEEVPGAELVPASEQVEGAYSGSFEAGGVWAVLDGDGVVRVNGRTVTVDHPGAYELLSFERSTRGELELEVGAGVTCYATCFTPGLATCS